jgi:hypothetical protein
VPSVDFIELFAWHEGCLGLFVESDSVTLWTEKKSPKEILRDSDKESEGQARKQAPGEEKKFSQVSGKDADKESEQGRR